MAISDYIPNIFGSAAPTNYETLQTLGLITPQQIEQQQKTANIQGLLGAGLALAQGMSRIGPKRSAAENLLSAFTGGFGAAGGAYQQGIQNIVQQQQLQSAAITQQQAANRLRSIEAAKRQYPDLAPLADIDPGKFAEEIALKQRIGTIGGAPEQGQVTPEMLRSQAQRAYTAGPNFKPFADSLMEQADRLEVESRIRPQATQPSIQQLVPQAEVQQPVIEGQALPGMTVTATPGPDAQLQQTKNQLLAQNSALSGVKTKFALDTVKANNDTIASIDKELDRFAVSGYDFDTLEKSVPEKFKPQLVAIKNLAQTQALGADQVRIAVQDVFKQVQESDRGQKIEGLPGEFAQMRFGTLDRTKLTPNQMVEVLRFADAPTSDQAAQLTRESQRLQFETGRGSPVPAGRGMFLNAPTQRVAPQPVVSQQVPPQVVVPSQSAPVQTAPTQPVPVAQAAPVQQAPVAPTQAKVSAVIDPRVAQNPLINQPDDKVPPKKKQELIQAQPGLIGASNYTLKNIVDARNAAQSLLDNPSYMKAISGLTAPVASKIPGTDAFTANEILNNILGRSFISEIQEMRANSPTGGAVGNVAVAEMNSLSKIRGALTLGMNEQELKKQLESYINNANRALKTIPNDYARTYGYNGEFDDLLSSQVVSPKPTTNKLPPGVKVRRKE